MHDIYAYEGINMIFFYEYMDSLNIDLDTKLLSDNAEYVRTVLVAAVFEIPVVCKRNYLHLEKINKNVM